MGLCGALAATTLLGFASTAIADNEGFTFEDLGSSQSDSVCVAKAERVFRRYKEEVKAGNIGTGNWTAALYDVYSDEYDAAISCNGELGGKVRATAVVYADDGTDSDVRKAIAARIKAIWRDMN
jgi:hypothetical protein